MRLCRTPNKLVRLNPVVLLRFLILDEPLIQPLDIKPSSKSYTFKVNKVNDLTMFYLQSVLSTTPRILLSAKINLPREQISGISHTILKQLTVVDHQHHG